MQEYTLTKTNENSQPAFFLMKLKSSFSLVALHDFVWACKSETKM